MHSVFYALAEWVKKEELGANGVLALPCHSWWLVAFQARGVLLRWRVGEGTTAAVQRGGAPCRCRFVMTIRGRGECRVELEARNAGPPWWCRAGLACAFVVAFASSLLAGRSAAGAPANACRVGISAETAQRLFAVLNHPPAETECKFEGVETHRTDLEARWSRQGTLLPPLRVVPRECATDTAQHSGPFVIDVPGEIAQSCASVVPLIAEFVKQVGNETPAGTVGSVDAPVFRVARALFVGIFLVVFGLLARGAARMRALDTRWVVMGIAAFGGALVLRAALPFSIGNWYSEVLPEIGPPPWPRFGPGYFALQSLFRDLGLWDARALLLSQVVIGAAALPLLLGVLWELDVGLEATAATLVLLIFAPFHARLSATASEHVLASTLCLGLLLCWLRAARTGDALWMVLTLLLFPAVCVTRIDMSAQAVLVLLWPLLRDRVERQAGGDRRSIGRRVALLGLVAASTLATAYWCIALPSQHPMPELAGQLFVLRSFIPQFWLLATKDPTWISLSAVLLAIPGVAAMAVRRPLLLLRVFLTVGGAFVALGRSFLPDELLSARYFLFTIPVFLIVSGQGFTALLTPIPSRFRNAVAAAGIVSLGAWTGCAAQTAYRVRYAFQDEYAFGRDALTRLPPGCTVYAVLLRSDSFPRDLDCCLDVPRSPLILDFPQLQFRYLPDTVASVFDGPGCVAYYESIACQITDDPHDLAVHDRSDRAAEYLRRRCTAARSLGQLEALAEGTTSPRATVNFFHGKRPHVGLYRWTP